MAQTWLHFRPGALKASFFIRNGLNNDIVDHHAYACDVLVQYGSLSVSLPSCIAEPTLSLVKKNNWKQSVALFLLCIANIKKQNYSSLGHLAPYAVGARPQETSARNPTQKSAILHRKSYVFYGKPLGFHWEPIETQETQATLAKS